MSETVTQINQNDSYESDNNETESLDESINDNTPDIYSRSSSAGSGGYYFHNMDQLMNSYFSNDDANVVIAIQNLEKSMKVCTDIIKEAMEQNAKCTLRIAKVIEQFQTQPKK